MTALGELGSPRRKSGKETRLNSAFQVRPAVFEDMDAILQLWQAMMREHQAGDERIELAPGALSAYRAYAGYHLANSESLVLVATRETADEPEVAGFVLAAISRNLPMFLPPRYGYLSDLAVAGNMRRLGIGRALLHNTADWLRGHEISTIQLQYYNFNAAGAAFWEAMGFKPFYTRMWLDL